jgi:ribonuclease BN (tRNA processing enzyme)
MRLTVLGSSGGYPVPGAACSGYLLEEDDTRIWIDAGSGTFPRLLEHCRPDELTAVLISHLHADHWTDLVLGIHALRFAFERETPLPVYGPAGWVETMGVVAEWAREEQPAFEAREVKEGETIHVGPLKILPVPVEHTADLDTYGFRIMNGSCSAAYSADSGPCQALIDLARDVDLFVCEAGAPGDEEMHMHLNGRQAGEFAARAGARRLLITHLSPNADAGETAVRARAAFGGPIYVAADGLSVDI